MIRANVLLGAFFLTICSLVASTTGALGMISRDQGERNEEAVLRYLRPILQSSGLSARIYYRANCQADADYPIPFPRLPLRIPAAKADGVSAIRDVFRHSSGVRITDDGLGLIRIEIGRVPRELLNSRISSIVLKPDQQYNTELFFLPFKTPLNFGKLF